MCAVSLRVRSGCILTYRPCRHLFLLLWHFWPSSFFIIQSRYICRCRPTPAETSLQDSRRVRLEFALNYTNTQIKQKIVGHIHTKIVGHIPGTFLYDRKNDINCNYCQNIYQENVFRISIITVINIILSFIFNTSWRAKHLQIWDWTSMCYTSSVCLNNA